MNPSGSRRGSFIEGGGCSVKPLVHKLEAKPLSGDEIERRSFAAIDAEVPHPPFTPEQWEVVRRMIHTTADFTLLNDVKFSPDAITSACVALRAGRPLYVDANMIRAGLSLSRLRAVNPSYGPSRIACHVADEDVAGQARAAGLPRSLFAVRKARAVLDGGIAVFGNAPVGLMELSRLIMEEKLRPALVLAMPVGFVHVVESKQELMALQVPFIAVQGRRGGSTLAVSAIHALCTVAAQPSRPASGR